jgi:ribosomal protein L11
LTGAATLTRVPVQVKQTDPGSEFISLQSICTSIIGTARSMGVTVVR